MKCLTEYAVCRVSHMPVGAIVTGRRERNLILICTYSGSKDQPIGRQDKSASGTRSRRDRFHIARVDGTTFTLGLRAGVDPSGSAAILFTLEGRDGAAIY